MAASKLTNIHDRYFRESLSKPEIARDFLRNYLSPTIVEQLDLSVLQLEKDSFVDKELQEHQSDLLYKTRLKTGNDTFVYILLEHKSYVDKWVAFQLLRYLVRIWEQWLQTERDKKETPKPQKLIPIIPLVLYHGKTVWKASTDFADLVTDADLLQPYIPSFNYQLTDLAGLDDEQIKGEVILRTTLLLFKHIADPDLHEKLPDILTLLNELINNQTILQYLETMLRYASQANPDVTQDNLRKVVATAFPEDKGVTMLSAYDLWVQEGETKMARENILTVINIRFEATTSPTEQLLQEIDDPAILRTLHIKALTVNSIDEFENAVKTFL